MRRQPRSTGLEALLEPSSPLPSTLEAALSRYFPPARGRVLAWQLLLGLLDLRLRQTGKAPDTRLTTLACGAASATSERLEWLLTHCNETERLPLQQLSALERDLLSRPLILLAEQALTLPLPQVSLEAPSDWLAPFFQRWMPPPAVRKLGEHMTPPWLARTLLQDLGWPQRWLEREGAAASSLPRLLDPACGTGVFLVQALALGLASGVGTPAQWLDALEGWDIQPHAVLATRVQLLLLAQQALEPDDGGGSAPTPEAPDSPGPRILCQDALAQDLEPHQRFPAVVGNPPWVGWETLAAAQRGPLLGLFQREGLWVHQGAQRRLGAGKKDLSMLFLARALSAWLRPGGRLCFLLPYSLLASRAAEGLRRRLEGPGVRPLQVDVLSALRPFPSTTVPAIALTVEAEGERAVPQAQRATSAGGSQLPWMIWKGRAGNSTFTTELQALTLPDVPRGEPWTPTVLSGQKTTGAGADSSSEPSVSLSSPRMREGLRAWEGANTGGANGILWVDVLDADILDAQGQGRLLIQNNPSLGRKSVPQRRGWVEATQVYPLLRGREVRAGVARPGGFILLTQDPESRMGLKPEVLAQLPLTQAWLEPFRTVLEARPLFQKFFLAQRAPWYSIYNVGSYTLSAWKVVWREQARELTAAAVGPLEALESFPSEWERLGLRVVLKGRPIIPDHKLMVVPCESQADASRLAAWLNSGPVRALAATFVQRTSAPVRLLDALLRSDLP